MDYAKCLALYEKLVATKPEVERKGDTMPYTSLNGHMFSVLNKDGTVSLRLASTDREAFLKKYNASQPVMYGMVMKEYVAIPEALLSKTSELAAVFESSYRYVGTLKPKATKRAKKSTPARPAKASKPAKAAKAAKKAVPAKAKKTAKKH
jgi:hypothetical protein